MFHVIYIFSFVFFSQHNLGTFFVLSCEWDSWLAWWRCPEVYRRPEAALVAEVCPKLRISWVLLLLRCGMLWLWRFGADAEAFIFIFVFIFIHGGQSTNGNMSIYDYTYTSQIHIYVCHIYRDREILCMYVVYIKTFTPINTYKFPHANMFTPTQIHIHKQDTKRTCAYPEVRSTFICQ